ncbi:HupE/UreJ family protein [Oceanicoccus sp. KOV_DT_Chl]|uniref:HupE/UreJ family protein n=1 Tax=Oceanicoccus sp. KOV_DT_Chl TaxID=1904639 RepID=UPI000C7AB543|nr:HupE/UreJ family protein [Oceanicoccus sp. KOV_DT_Chl]
MNYFKSLQIVFLTILLLLSNALHSHEIRPAIIDVNIAQNGEIQIQLIVNLEALIADIGPQHSDTSQSENAEFYDRLRKLSAEQLAEELQIFSPRLLQDTQLRADELPVVLDIISSNIPAVGDVELARDSVINMAGQLPLTAQTLSWRWGERLPSAALRVSTKQQADIYTAYLQNGQASKKINVSGILVSGGSAAAQSEMVQQSSFDIFNNYLLVGFTHILPKGLDHILFVVGLFLLSTQWRPLLWQVSSFTLAHTVTLALGMLGIVTLSPAIVEPLIAASIVYVCVENIFAAKLSRWRPLLVFAFGLLHGLGFAGVLTEIGLSSQSFVTGLIAFNIGVELGQLTVIALCFLIVGFWFGNKPWYRQQVTIPASIGVALIGAYWFIERVFW